ncbi:hypothetical protein Pcac1_g28928 [Phytophthora cactorum]|uniref:Uncharacterized protein n=1 Tax=Phytophthora cactorum TaxID=29920 RepID=A0A8T1A8L2_9STRA|nr:hypothetical protein Pcac1_g28928 [Phytophthora cactorum]KAG2875575.1 hypothetical protein PC115_g23871 [Phytophthora cactorum]KAG2967023.1 hypothetical protein PC119_g24580 [Phytophthora cactorum]
MEAVSSARRVGDEDKSRAMIEEMMKLVGNSAFGRSGMDMSKHKQVKYESNEDKIKSRIEHFTFHGLEELNDSCEITMKKRRLNNKNPIHLSIAIYQLAKLRMLEFYYDCIDFTSIDPISSIKKWTRSLPTSLSAVIIHFRSASNLSYVITSNSTSTIGSHETIIRK